MRFVETADPLFFSVDPVLIQSQSQRMRAQMGTAGLTTLFLVFMLAGRASADFSCVTNGGTITITGYSGPGGSVVIPDSISGLPVKAIHQRAFSGNPTITSLTIPGSITNLVNSAFHNCTNLTSIEVSLQNLHYSSLDGILFNAKQTALLLYPAGRVGDYTTPNRVTSFADLAFISCAKLTNLVVGSSVTNIGIQQLGSCPNLTAIIVESSNSAYGSFDGVLFNKSQTTIVQYPPGRAGSYIVPNGVGTIGPGAFLGCSKLTGIIIPETVTSIGEAAFGRCSGLTSVLLPDSIVSVGRLAFMYCLSLADVTISQSLTNIVEGLFAECGLTNVAIPDGVRTIEEYAFRGCTNLTSVAFGSGVDSIRAGAFESCTSMTNLQLGLAVTNIGSSAFAGCHGLKRVTISENVTTLGNHAFGRCTNLTEIIVNPLNSFYGSVDGVLFDSSQTTLIQYPGGKSGSYLIPDGVADVLAHAFSLSPNLISVTIPAGVGNIDVSAFRYCASLSLISVDSSNSFYAGVDGVLFNKSQTTLIQYPGGKSGGYDVPTGVTQIEDFAFS